MDKGLCLRCCREGHQSKDGPERNDGNGNGRDRNNDGQKRSDNPRERRKRPCRFGKDCKKKRECKFWHPGDRPTALFQGDKKSDDPDTEENDQSNDGQEIDHDAVHQYVLRRKERRRRHRARKKERMRRMRAEYDHIFLNGKKRWKRKKGNKDDHADRKERSLLRSTLERYYVNHFGLTRNQIPMNEQVTIHVVARNDDEIFEFNVVLDTGSTISTITPRKAAEFKRLTGYSAVKGKAFAVENGGQSDERFSGDHMWCDVMKPGQRTTAKIKMYEMPHNLIPFDIIIG